MFTALETEPEISEAQAQLLAKLEQETKRTGTVTVGHQGGSDEPMVRWFPDVNMWHGYIQKPTRHWNAFGMGDPFSNTPTITVEINPDLAGVNSRVNGVFLQDEAGRIYLAHRGRLGGGRKGIGKTAFLKSYEGELVEVELGGSTKQLILVACLGDANFLESLARFVMAAKSFKDDRADAKPLPSIVTNQAAWWVNQGSTYAAERDAGIVWAPQTDKRGATLTHHQNVNRVKAGDLLIHYANGIRALGVATADGEDAERPESLPEGSWQRNGYQAKVDYFELDVPIALKEIPEALRRDACGPFDKSGGVKQAYMHGLPISIQTFLRTNMNERWPAESPWAKSTDRLVAIYISNTSKSNLEFSLDRGRWGWKNDHDDYPDVAPGDLVLFGVGFTGGSPRTTPEKFRQHGLTGVVLGRVTSQIGKDDAPFWPDEVDGVSYPYRLSFELVERRGPVALESIDHEFGGDVAEGLRMSATGGGRGVLVEVAASDRFNTVERSIGDVLHDFSLKLKAAGLDYGTRHDELVQTFVISLATKRLLLLTGLSGSGKTRIAQAFGQWMGPERYKVIAVRPDWTGPDALLGFENGLSPLKEGQHAWNVPETLAFLLRASQHPQEPHLLLLDEMNLAHVERYFAEVLSGMESGEAVVPNLSRGKDGEWRATDASSPLLSFPSNVFVVGTVNIDETTYMFSPKVLDRANTIEFRVLTDDLKLSAARPTALPPGEMSMLRKFLHDSSRALEPDESSQLLSKHLRKLHALLASMDREFGHRTFFEAIRYGRLLHESEQPDVLVALDLQVLQKILPRFHGSARQMTGPLNMIGQWCFVGPDAFDAKKPFDATEAQAAPPALPRAFTKIQRMARRLRENHFVSFAE